MRRLGKPLRGAKFDGVDPVRVDRAESSAATLMFRNEDSENVEVLFSNALNILLVSAEKLLLTTKLEYSPLRYALCAAKIVNKACKSPWLIWQTPSASGVMRDSCLRPVSAKRAHFDTTFKVGLQSCFIPADESWTLYCVGLDTLLSLSRTSSNS